MGVCVGGVEFTGDLTGTLRGWAQKIRCMSKNHVINEHVVDHHVIVNIFSLCVRLGGRSVWESDKLIEWGVSKSNGPLECIIRSHILITVY